VFRLNTLFLITCHLSGVVAYWSCAPFAEKSAFPSLWECERCAGTKTADASLFQIALLIISGSFKRGEEESVACRSKCRWLAEGNVSRQ